MLVVIDINRHTISSLVTSRDYFKPFHGVNHVLFAKGTLYRVFCFPRIGYGAAVL